MGKKKYILLILLLLIPAIIGTGVSTWIIINEQPIKNPEYNYDVVTDKYVSYESVIYNGGIQLPVINDLIDEEVTLWYRETGETSFVEKFMKCPLCAKEISIVGGCKTCSSCGYSKCD